MAYLDHMSATPMHPAAREVLLAAYDEGWADPAKLYGAARRARLLLDDARGRVATAIGVRADELSFTSSGTTAIQHGLLGLLAGRARAGNELVLSAVEHSAVLKCGDHHAATGGEVRLVGVDLEGRVDPATVAASATTAAVALQHANHEVGTLQPVAEVAALAAGHGVPLFVDAAASVGHVPVDVAGLGAAVLAASAHKWGGPPGVGVLAVRKGTRWRAAFPADEREGGRVPGYGNLPAVLAAAAALDARLVEMADGDGRLRLLVERIRAAVPARVPDVEVVGHPVERLPHVVTFSCLYVDGEALLTELDRRDIAVSSGSSCTADTLRPSHVLEAMGVLTHGNVRVSLGRDTTSADVDDFLDVLPEVVATLRQRVGAP